MRFLIIDDNSNDRELVVRKLRREFPNAEFIEVVRSPDIDHALEHEQFDVVLTDYQLNWTDGLQILNRVKIRHPDVPVLMVTGTGSEEIAVEGLRSGLSNYILKNHLDLLPSAIHESLKKIRLHKQYEEAIEQLRLSEERYREIFEQGLTAIFVASPDGKMLTCNPAFAGIFGFNTVDDAMQVNLRSLYPHIEAYERFIDELTLNRRLEYHEAEMTRCDGTPLYIVENVLGTFENEELVEIKGFIFDNTERRKLAEQLQQAQRLESVGLLVSGIAHDFNNMLGGILGYTSRALTRVTPSHPLYDNLRHIQDISNRATKMTQQLLAFSRRQVLEQTDVNLNTVVESLLSFLSKILADRIDIKFDPAPDLQTVHVDYAQMEQVLMNLCVNAHDAMPNGGKLLIQTCNVSQEEAYRLRQEQIVASAYVMLSVKDDGVGMDEHIISHIFEPFFTTKEVGKGTGLGLSMVHGIIGQHNGFIDVRSDVGKGTTFSIYLPAVDSAPISIPPTFEDQSHLRQTVQGGDETILVVEDDPDLRYLMEEALNEYGYTVMSAADGEEGLALFKQHQDTIALVVSDLITPKMKGKELYDNIHALSKDIRFLFVSGYQANQISQNFVLDKEFTFLQKPFDLDELASKVRDMLERA